MINICVYLGRQCGLKEREMNSVLLFVHIYGNDKEIVAMIVSLAKICLT